MKLTYELIDLPSYENLRITFQENACKEFWTSIRTEYPELSKQAVLILLPLRQLVYVKHNFQLK